MRTIKYSPEYQVTFSLLVGEPSSLMVDWDIEQAIDSYLSPFVQFINSVTNLTISSQILLHTSLPIKPIKLFLDGKDAFILTPKELPHFINSAEWNFASVVNSFPPLNFLLYVPSLEESPLYLTRTDHTLLSTNAFLIPRWGGIIVANPILPINDAHNTKKKVLLKEIAMKNYIEIYLQQLRSLLGIRRCWTDSNFLSKSIKVEYENSLNGITLNELDRWTRKISLSNLEDTVNTLGSLMVLIEEIDGMVVEDKIRDYVLISLDSIKKLYENLEKMNYNEANYLSQIGIQYSEKAFFDKSLVSMLYFPTEHKYAVYLPFFLPALMPVFKSLISSLKSMKKKWKEKKEIDRKKKNM
ncbi:hypothetical protein HDU92_003108 [Lobulomyces angularis]|nr:hypothetical protein HDU92_003108 [Lobulomyces angularis]